MQRPFSLRRWCSSGVSFLLLPSLSSAGGFSKVEVDGGDDGVKLEDAGGELLEVEEELLGRFRSGLRDMVGVEVVVRSLLLAVRVRARLLLVVMQLRGPLEEVLPQK